MTVEVIVVVNILALLIWDYFLWKNPNKQTISRKLIDHSKNYPLIPFIMGFFVGHWYG